MIYVIGSGPSAVAAASAVAARQLEVTLVDPALQLEPDRQQVLSRLSGLEPQFWDDADVQILKGKGIPSDGEPATKLAYGSDYAYRDIPFAPSCHSDNARVRRSFALGGLSNVWGACILPYPDEELSDWPITPAELDAHYRAVLGLLPHTGCEDGLSIRFPSRTDTLQVMPMSRQARELMQTLERNREALEQAGVLFGASRLAVDAEGRHGQQECRQCGMCAYGCPYGLIYRTETTMRDLLGNAKVHYLPGHWLERFEENDGRVKLYLRDVASLGMHQVPAERVFIAAGVVESARIVLESLEIYDQSVRALHNDRFMLPFLRYRKTPGVTKERLHTLSQVFMEICNGEVCEHTVHLQLYSYNERYRQALEWLAGAFAPLLGWPIRAVLERMLIVFGYLHSDHSSHSELMLQRDRGRAGIRVHGQVNPHAVNVLEKIERLLRRNRKLIGGVAARASLEDPGASAQIGGTFPMRAAPTGTESDILGRPAGLRSVHLVDASVLPSLSATTITLMTMANTHRIVTHALRE